MLQKKKEKISIDTEAYQGENVASVGFCREPRRAEVLEFSADNCDCSGVIMYLYY